MTSSTSMRSRLMADFSGLAIAARRASNSANKDSTDIGMPAFRAAIVTNPISLGTKIEAFARKDAASSASAAPISNFFKASSIGVGLQPPMVGGARVGVILPSPRRMAPARVAARVA